ncbi:dihydroneopterin aldolase [Arcticibacter sp. MXS-1]|uniref:dihydroneopterin aldolase n=1 Tax=Arcticibacter sp. MXS-1 TaxID=3341726 RepID=UPI0035A88433
MAKLRKTIGLEGVRFFAFHGYYPEEQILGSEFIVDITTGTYLIEDGNDELADTLNYEHLLEIASDEMKNTRKLLETVALRMLERIRASFPHLDLVVVRIKKLHLSLPGETNSVVEYRYEV